MLVVTDDALQKSAQNPIMDNYRIILTPLVSGVYDLKHEVFLSPLFLNPN